MILPCAVILIGMAFVLAWQTMPRWMTICTRHLRRWSGLTALIVGLLLAATALHVTGAGPASPAATPPPLSTALYTALQFFVLNANPSDFDSRSPWVTAWVAFLASLLFIIVAAQGIAMLFHDSLTRLRLAGARGHVVICGAGRIGHQLVADLVDPARGDPRRVVVIERDAGHPDIPWLQENGIVVVTGSAQRAEVLDKAGVDRAAEVFVVTGSDEVNVECVVEIRDRLYSKKSWRFLPRFGTEPPLRCYVHLRDRDLAASLCSRTAVIEKAPFDPAPGGTASHAQRGLDIEVFNVTERTVRKLFEKLGQQPHLLPLQGDEVAHIVIVGFGDFGRSLALSLAELGHFPNQKRLRVTIADRDIERKARHFLARYPRFTSRSHPDAVPMWDPCGDASSVGPFGAAPGRADEWAHDSAPGLTFICNARFIELPDVAEERWVEALDRDLTLRGVKPLVFVCFDEDKLNFKLAERLRAARDRHGEGEKKDGVWRRRDDWPIYVWIPAQRELSAVLLRSGDDPFPFGHCYGSVSYAEVTDGWCDRLARFLKLGYTAHYDATRNAEAKHAWADARQYASLLPDPTGMTPRSRSWQAITDATKRCWDAESNEAFRASDRSAAIHAVVKLASLGIVLPDTPGDSQGASAAASRALRNAKRTLPVDSDVHLASGRPGEEQEQAESQTLKSLACMEHYRWCSERLLAGWHYAPLAQPAQDADDDEKRRHNDWQKDQKNRRLKHPCLVPFEHLPTKLDREKDHFCVQIVLALAAKDGFLPIGLRPAEASPPAAGTA